MSKYKEIIQLARATYNKNVEETMEEKSKSIKELSCIYYGLQDAAERNIKEDDEAFVTKLYLSKSNVSFMFEFFLMFLSWYIL